MPADAGAQTAALILALAREEQQLIDAGGFDALDELHIRRQAAMERLPQPLSEVAAEHLRQALALQQQITAALAAATTTTAAELGRVGHGRTAMAGYAPAGLDARPVLDASA